MTPAAVQKALRKTLGLAPTAPIPPATYIATMKNLANTNNYLCAKCVSIGTTKTQKNAVLQGYGQCSEPPGCLAAAAARGGPSRGRALGAGADRRAAARRGARRLLGRCTRARAVPPRRPSGALAGRVRLRRAPPAAQRAPRPTALTRTSSA
jgi:hypothetical protein